MHTVKICVTAHIYTTCNETLRQKRFRTETNQQPLELFNFLSCLGFLWFLFRLCLCSHFKCVRTSLLGKIPKLLKPNMDMICTKKKYYLLWSILTLQQQTSGKSLGTARFAHSAGRCPKESSAGKSHVQTLRLISFKLFRSHMLYKFQKQLQLKSWGWATPWLHSKALGCSSHLQLIWWDITWYFRAGVGEMLHLFGWVEYVECIGMPAWRWHGFVLDISNVAACFHYISVPSLSQKPSNKPWFFQSCKSNQVLCKKDRLGFAMAARFKAQAAGWFFLMSWVSACKLQVSTTQDPQHSQVQHLQTPTSAEFSPSAGFFVSGMDGDGQGWPGMVGDGWRWDGQGWIVQGQWCGMVGMVCWASMGQFSWAAAPFWWCKPLRSWWLH